MQRRFPIEAGPRLSDADRSLVRGHNLHEDTLQRAFPGAVLHAFDDYTLHQRRYSSLLGGNPRWHDS